jgi:hypothetical protein
MWKVDSRPTSAFYFFLFYASNPKLQQFCAPNLPLCHPVYVHFVYIVTNLFRIVLYCSTAGSVFSDFHRETDKVDDVDKWKGFIFSFRLKFVQFYIQHNVFTSRALLCAYTTKFLEVL